MPTVSYADYARVLLALPGSAAQIAPKVSMTPRGLRVLLRKMWALKLVAPSTVQPKRCNGHVVPVWSRFDTQAHPDIRSKPLRPSAQLIAFASIWRCLEVGTTAHAVAAETGSSFVSVYRLLAGVRTSLHVCEWEPDAMGRAVAVWMVGKSRDMVKPSAKTNSQKYAEARQRQMYRAIGGMAA